jgi:hypothetical protein
LARAKHTDRTAARRRHRQEIATLASTADGGETAAESAPETDVRRQARASGTARPGIVASLRAAFRPVDLRADLQTAPETLLTWTVPLAIVAAVVSSAVFILSTNDLGRSLDFSLPDPYAGKPFGIVSNVSFLVVGFFVTPPPAAGAFLVGFFAKRASWLGGLVVGVAAAACYSAILLSPAGRLLIHDNDAVPYILQSLLLAPVGAVLFASAAAWYRRFLTLANPNRPGQQRGRQAAKPKPRPAPGRTADRR